MTELNVKGLKSLKKWENYNSWFCPPKNVCTNTSLLA